ncbi:Indole-3-acetaldehyde oxidase [Acorus calamus]|uniref:Indole-3-acetaldehyde oxidase n=1 Tax=Acorus calamus TaxID=4465 RepID=A0AAV9E9N7_ACOCL|nr:Indole-3-acetaldehyde oxidase [Acorus calamus]
MRAPGDVQGTYIAEAVIEHVASTLSVDTSSIRKKNLHTHESLQLFYKDSCGEPHEHTLPAILEKLANSSSFDHRAEMIKKFNMRNKWRKRGISSVPILYEVSLRPAPGRVGILNDGSVVVEVGGIQIGQGLWKTVKQMTAFGLGKLWGDESIDLLERVRVVQSDSLSLIQGGFTGGSTTSEASCEPVRLACNILSERLAPVKERLQDQMGEVSWDLLILQIESSFVQGIGFFMLEEHLTNSDGLVVSDSTWTYKIPTVDTIPKQFNVEILNNGHHEKRILSSKDIAVTCHVFAIADAFGEPPLLLAVSVEKQEENSRHTEETSKYLLQFSS